MARKRKLGSRWPNYQTLYLVFSLHLCLAVATLRVFAADWSFEQHTQPEITDFGPIVDDIFSQYIACDIRLTIAFHSYLSTYPDFEQADTTELFARWARHISEFTDEFLANCVVMEISDELEVVFNLMPDLPTDFFFCGVFSRSPKNALESEIARLIGELIDHGELGNNNVVRQILSFHLFRDAVRLSPTFEYFIRKTSHLGYPELYNNIYRDPAIEGGYYDDPQYQEIASRYNHLAHLERLSAIIDPTMLSLLDRAVDEKDLSAVLATIKDCDGL